MDYARLVKAWIFRVGLAILAGLNSFGQGQVVFANKVGTEVDAPMEIGGTINGPGPSWTAALCLLSEDGTVTPLTPTTTFRAAGFGAAAIADRYLIPVTVDVPGSPPGTAATFIVRAWLSAVGSYEAAVNGGFGGLPMGPPAGQSAPFTVVVGGGLLPSANLVSLRNFTSFLSIPEPSVASLGFLGAAGIWLVRVCARRS